MVTKSYLMSYLTASAEVDDVLGPLCLLGHAAVVPDVPVELRLLAGVQHLANVAAIAAKVCGILDEDVLFNFFLEILLLDPDLRDEIDNCLLDGVEVDVTRQTDKERPVRMLGHVQLGVLLRVPEVGAADLALLVVLHQRKVAVDRLGLEGCLGHGGRDKGRGRGTDLGVRDHLVGICYDSKWLGLVNRHLLVKTVSLLFPGSPRFSGTRLPLASAPGGFEIFPLHLFFDSIIILEKFLYLSSLKLKIPILLR